MTLKMTEGDKMGANMFLWGSLGALISILLIILREKNPKLARVLFIIFMLTLLVVSFVEKQTSG